MGFFDSVCCVSNQHQAGLSLHFVVESKAPVYNFVGMTSSFRLKFFFIIYLFYLFIFYQQHKTKLMCKFGSANDIIEKNLHCWPKLHFLCWLVLCWSRNQNLKNKLCNNVPRSTFFRDHAGEALIGTTLFEDAKMW